MTSPFKLLWCLGVVMAAGWTPAFAGPPLLTDDPDTPGPNNWEINIATTLEKRGHNWEYEAPLLDINYGVGERIQLKYEVPWVVLDPDGAGTRSGAGNSLAGVKWRFLDQDTAGIDVSTYPQVEFNTVESSVHRGLVEDGSSFLLPLELAHAFGSLTVYGEMGSCVESTSIRRVVLWSGGGLRPGERAFGHGGAAWRRRSFLSRPRTGVQCRVSLGVVQGTQPDWIGRPWTPLKRGWTHRPPRLSGIAMHLLSLGS